MRRIIKAKPNQSLLDMIIREYGTLEAGMQFARENSVGISRLPLTGDEFTAAVVDRDITDTETVKYLTQNEVVIGTKGVVPPLAWSVVLKPVMEAVPNVSAAPHTIGYYSYDLNATTDFINVNDLVSDYLSTNKVYFETEERYIFSMPYDTAPQLYTTSMPVRSISTKLNWSVGLGYMMVWSDLSSLIKTVTFKDVKGNEAFIAPIIILDNLTQGVVEYLIGDILIETVSASPDAVTIRITRLHNTISLSDFSHHTMEWLGIALTCGTPDPDDPTNADKKIFTLTAGNYTIGVKTTYEQPGVGVYPPSAFTMVFNVQ